jgi:hypothetical protein
MDPRKRQTATATPAEPGGLFGFASGARHRPTRPTHEFYAVAAPAMPASRVHALGRLARRYLRIRAS